MFIRKKASANKTKMVIQIVENQRVGNTTKQTVLRHIGTGQTPEEIEQLKRVAALVKGQLESEARTRSQIKPQFAAQLEQVKDSGKTKLVDISQLEEVRLYIFKAVSEEKFRALELFKTSGDRIALKFNYVLSFLIGTIISSRYFDDVSFSINQS